MQIKLSKNQLNYEKTDPFRARNDSLACPLSLKLDFNTV
jgi:hypothetical protein